MFVFNRSLFLSILLLVFLNVARILAQQHDSLIVTSGSTYSFTVDTPEDGGLKAIDTSVEELVKKMSWKKSPTEEYIVTDSIGNLKTNGRISKGDQLIVTKKGKAQKIYHIIVKQGAKKGKLVLDDSFATVYGKKDLILNYTVGQRSPNATVEIYFPAEILIDLENTSVDVIGRGEVKLKNFHKQSIGRVGVNYPHKTVGEIKLKKLADGRTLAIFKGLDLRPENGTDIKIKIKNVSIDRIGNYLFEASYATVEPDTLLSIVGGTDKAILQVSSTVNDLKRVPHGAINSNNNESSYTSLDVTWSGRTSSANIYLMQSIDAGKSWQRVKNAAIDSKNSSASIKGLTPNVTYVFQLKITGGPNAGLSNKVYYHTGPVDARAFGVKGDGRSDDTDKINEAINNLHQRGGGTLLFSDGTYMVRTVHLKSNVWLNITQGATIMALRGGDAPEATWFSDKKYRSGLSPTDVGPYENPENWLTKQDVGHTYFRNAMFFGERIDNVKIIGNGRITGNGNLVNGDKVMNNPVDWRCDKMFTFKLCANIEIGGYDHGDDLWYDPKRDEPYYIAADSSKRYNIDNMLNIDRGGHFALLATGTDNVHVHDTYFGKNSTANVRDIYDFMGCNNVTVKNIYSKVSSDDIVKLGSDCSLGFTRTASNYKIRNIIGDTNCNLFQIGSETADDIKNVCVDNIYVLGANKAGFSISTNDGGLVSDVHLNCGHTGVIHSRSKMLRTRTPFFISISNRGRILGAIVSRYKFYENEKIRDEILVENVNIGRIENIQINKIDIEELYAGSSYGNPEVRWKAYDGSQPRATPIIAGYKLPNTKDVEGGLNFKLPNGKHIGYIQHIRLKDVHILSKGGYAASDTLNNPPELGVGQYNVSNLNVQPAYGFWVRHAKRLEISDCAFHHEQEDGRYTIFLDDVQGAQINRIKMAHPKGSKQAIRWKESENISIMNTN